jgi:plasmid stabilization system protein ParE
VRLRYTERATDDLEGIQAYIAEHDPSAALQVGRRIRHAIEFLIDFPRLGRPSRFDKIRVLVVAATPYAVYYSVRPRAREVVILHIRHGRRRPPRRKELLEL